MKYQKVKMVVTFIVPVGREGYGCRQTELPWKQYAEHDMQERLKNIDEMGDPTYVYVEESDISFEWLEKFEKETE